MGQNMTEQKFTTVITPKTGWFDVNLREVWDYRDLILLFVKRNFVSQYKQTILGPAWAFIQPFLTTIVFTLILATSLDWLPAAFPLSHFIFPARLSGSISADAFPIRPIHSWPMPIQWERSIIRAL